MVKALSTATTLRELYSYLRTSICYEYLPLQHTQYCTLGTEVPGTHQYDYEFEPKIRCSRPMGWAHRREPDRARGDGRWLLYSTVQA